MFKLLCLFFSLVAFSFPVWGETVADLKRWETHAKNVTITRDDWGIAHINGKTDADVVFGLIYSQAEDDFNRVETNYLNSMGLLAEAEGESAIFKDLRMKLFIDPEDLKAQYKASPAWLKALMDSWADGLNYYLSKNPAVKPKVIKKFEPWMALSFSEGSIGGDIEKISVANLESFYGRAPSARLLKADALIPEEPRGSNGIAIAAANTVNGKPLFLINPHTSFFFRAEVQMTSKQGLNAYGAVTWGQFFIYQGFNERLGWMHTSSGVDNIDEYAETIIRKDEGLFYRFGNEDRPIKTRKIEVSYKTAAGSAKKEFTAFYTHRGPVIREAGGKWISVRLMQEPLKALIQSYSRTKARNYAEFVKTMENYTNSSNNTIYADADGNIAYFHANFIPRRNQKFNWSEPVDGSDPETEWKGIHTIDESPKVLNPRNGWLYNTNNWPYSAAAEFSPKKSDFPGYMERGGENARGIHAIRVLENRKDFTIDSLLAAAYDSYLPEFAKQIPLLAASYQELSASDPLKAKLVEPVQLLKNWDYRFSKTSVETSLAIYWGEEIGRQTRNSARTAGMTNSDYIAEKATAKQRTDALNAAIEKLTNDFGTWKTPWGEINRFQRLTGDIVQPFNDSAPSIPVGFTSAEWGSLASFGARQYPTTKKRYGTSGNSFVAVVEFGKKVRARAISAGGQHSDPNNPNFNNQAPRYADGNLREVYFYPEQLKKRTVRVYQP